MKKYHLPDLNFVCFTSDSKTGNMRHLAKSKRTFDDNSYHSNMDSKSTKNEHNPRTTANNNTNKKTNNKTTRLNRSFKKEESKTNGQNGKLKKHKASTSSINTGNVESSGVGCATAPCIQ